MLTRTETQSLCFKMSELISTCSSCYYLTFFHMIPHSLFSVIHWFLQKWTPHNTELLHSLILFYSLLSFWVIWSVDQWLCSLGAAVHSLYVIRTFRHTLMILTCSALLPLGIATNIRWTVLYKQIFLANLSARRKIYTREPVGHPN